MPVISIILSIFSIFSIMMMSMTMIIYFTKGQSISMNIKKKSKYTGL